MWFPHVKLYKRIIVVVMNEGITGSRNSAGRGLGQESQAMATGTVGGSGSLVSSMAGDLPESGQASGESGAMCA